MRFSRIRGIYLRRLRLVSYWLIAKNISPAITGRLPSSLDAPRYRAGVKRSAASIDDGSENGLLGEELEDESHLTPEEREKRERDRRYANNARER